jgi:hypothetical protein
LSLDIPTVINSADTSAQQRLARVEREDLVMFVNACLSCTSQGEFYDDYSYSYGQKVSLDFLHEYILGNYRRLYCLTLGAGINHFNQAQIILKLLASGNRTRACEIENALITTTLNRLPPQRAWGLLLQLRKLGINNRRARSIAQHYIISRGDKLPFQAVKYRSKLRAIVSHFHLKLEPELNDFLFGRWKQSFSNPLFEQFRQASYSASAIYQLPFTVAEGLAVKHQIPREIFLAKIQSQMTAGEKLRMQESASKVGTSLSIDPHKLSLTKLALYILSLSPIERQQRHTELTSWLQLSAAATLRQTPLKMGKVAAILDRSYSSSGSREKRRRPLGIALAVDALLRAAATEYRAFWTVPIDNALMVTARGQTNLAIPLLDALQWKVDTILIVSDGWENDPPEAVAELLRVYYGRLDKQRRIEILHCNPVFNPNDYELKQLSPLIPTIGIREAEDLPTVLAFMRFADGRSHLGDLEKYLLDRSNDILSGDISPTSQRSRGY